MQARDVMAMAIQTADAEDIPNGFADSFDDENVSDWSAYLAARAIAALNDAGYVVVPLSAATNKS